MNDVHTIHYSTSEDGYAATCNCRWRVVCETREERNAATQRHREQIPRPAINFEAGR